MVDLTALSLCLLCFAETRMRMALMAVSNGTLSMLVVFKKDPMVWETAMRTKKAVKKKERIVLEVAGGGGMRESAGGGAKARAGGEPRPEPDVQYVNK